MYRTYAKNPLAGAFLFIKEVAWICYIIMGSGN